MISFPENDHDNYEKILMHYSMRCKDALVSTGSDRNRGCGEWDYSCNTYIVDSTRVDSIKASSPEFNMPGYSEDIFEYTDRSTYEFYQDLKARLEISDVLRQDDYTFSSANFDAESTVFREGNALNWYFVIDPEWMDENDVSKFNAIKFSNANAVRINDLQIRIAESDMADIDLALASGILDWQSYHNFDVELQNEDDLIGFTESFRWDRQSYIIVQISFSGISGDLESLRTDIVEAGKLKYFVLEDSRYVRMGSSGYLEYHEAIPEIDDEISICFWQKASGVNPVNSTIFEGVDEANRRSVNIHFPWGNSQIYWDCGNEGTSYDRINKTVDISLLQDQWTHWAFTKNALSGEMHIYLNGELWHSGFDKYRSINLEAMNIGANFSNSLSHYGDVDEFMIFDKALTAEEIRGCMNSKIADSHSLYDNLVAGYSFDSEEDIVEGSDNSAFLRQANIQGQLASVEWNEEDYRLHTYDSQLMPALQLVDGVFISSVMDSISLDSVINLPQKVEHFVLDGTDLKLEWEDYFYAAGEYPVYDGSGAIVDFVNYPATGNFERGELIYYNKSPMAFEIMSFVTPYGIGLDFGEEGLTWTFDVTDFGPILKGDKRIYMSRGGQWQEDMDIRFEFIEGVPDRDVMDIQQIWRVDQVPYGSILNDWRFEPRQFEYDPEVASYVIKTAITGHGQEGEFIPRTHFIDVDGFVDSWSVWKECAENPVYPQGGTWVYDRAGWCPGMATDVRVYDVSPYFQFSQTPFVDYGVQTASGDSRYIVSSQLLKYGAANKSYDAGVSEIQRPSDRIEFGRYNPSCHAPIITIRNHGAETLREAVIYYGIKGKTEKSYNWQGALPFLISQTIELPYDPALAIADQGDIFFARIEIPGVTDENVNNNELVSPIDLSDHYNEPIVIEWRTNFTPQETTLRVLDSDGNTVLLRQGASLNTNSTYRDTLTDLNGCYTVLVSDTDNDGISWWANNDGDGYVRVKPLNGSWKTIATDFGAFVEYNFTSGVLSSVKETELSESIVVYPNPSQGEIFIEGLDKWDSKISLSLMDMSGKNILRREYQQHQLEGRALNLASMLEKGSYLLRLQDSERVALKKLLIF